MCTHNDPTHSRVRNQRFVLALPFGIWGRCRFLVCQQCKAIAIRCRRKEQITKCSVHSKVRKCQVGKTSGLGGASHMTFRPGDGTSILFETKQHQTFSKPNLATLGFKGKATPGMRVNIDSTMAPTPLSRFGKYS